MSDNGGSSYGQKSIRNDSTEHGEMAVLEENTIKQLEMDMAEEHQRRHLAEKNREDAAAYKKYINEVKQNYMEAVKIDISEQKDILTEYETWWKFLTDVSPAGWRQEQEQENAAKLEGVSRRPVPSTGEGQDVMWVHGKCVCRHNTAGDHCERCAPLYNDRPWQAANGILGTPHECQKCKCNGHAKSCHFDRGLWAASGRRSGGVCDDCRHNTEGRHCQNCKKGFYRDPSRPKTAADSCRPCSCHLVGAVLSGGSALCNPSDGECTCKPGVGGSHCDRCMTGHWGLHEYGCRPCDCAGDCDPYTGDCVSGTDVEVSYTATGHMGHSSNSSEPALFRVEELFSALHHSEKCECVEMTLGSPKLFCAMEYDYVLMVRVTSAHDKGSHAEVEVKVKKVLYHSPQMKIKRGGVTLYPESWTTQGCTCPILNPGSDYVVAGHENWRTGQLMVNTKSLVKPWKPSLGHKLLHILRKDCGRL
ncbi:netrin-4-like [Diretmus argenteus]